jgi:Na+-driven multidrug efflux pump
VSLWLAYRADWGAVGLWWGFVAGLAAVAIFLVARIRQRLSSAVARMEIDVRAP